MRVSKLPRILRFKSWLLTALWGTENWVVSARPTGATEIVGGPLAGKTLRDVWPDFPLLFKLIDTQMRISVQVHPNERTSVLTGGEPKTEMWCLLTDGVIYAGLKPGVDARAVEEAIRKGNFTDILVRHEGKAGDIFYIPGGLVHAMGDNLRLYEVQQSSATTFRLYDWGRVGPDGRPRQLHIAEALQAIDYSLPPPRPVQAVESPYFAFHKVSVSGRAIGRLDAAFAVFYVLRGALRLEGELFEAGESALVTSGGDLALEGTDAALFVTLPGGGAFNLD